MRVALLSLHARVESYLDDSGLRALVAPLAARGHQATLLDAVQGARAEGDWLTEVGGLLRGERYDVVVLSRAWSEALVDHLRASLSEGGRLVRLGRGAASPLDPRLDAVLDHGGLLAYIDGGAPNAAAWRRTRDALRALRVLPVGADGDGLPAPGRSLVDASGSAGRPTLSGPAVGCPFLVDARTSPAFADTALDPARTQTKGCSFCLDNVGAYAAFSEEDVVGAWLAGLRRIRAARPDAREILLTDERPHPYLPAFFRALLDEPDLQPVELLIKTRVDWLMEFADGALTEALKLAERGGHVLHVYLVGFENFDQHHLDLFNKGVVVADNLAAATRLRELGREFPRALEFRRLRAHGIILFTPWTGPEALVENARQMRAVGFAEFRSQALRTRLRLHPHVPLHAKAAADGLLVEAFEAGRPDRAAEQGYDASVPWRFQDPRTEAVFRAANRLAALEPALAEADVLELVARFVIRHPGLGGVPDDAVLPIHAALRTWGPSPTEVIAALGPVLAGCDREVDGVLAGTKPACMKEGVPAADAEGLARAYRTMGLAAALVSHHDLDGASGDHVPARRSGAYAIVAVARDEATLASVLEHQRALEQRHDPDAVTRMGVLMGFPPCCTAAFHGRRDRGDNLDLERAPFREHPDAPLLVENNRVGPFSLLSHLLCSPACQPSADAAQRVIERLRAEDADATDRALERLAAPVLFCDYTRRAQLQGRWSGDEFLVDALAVPSGAALGVPTEGVASIALSSGAARLRYHDGSERWLRAPRPLLVEPGRALAPSARAALTPGLADDALPSPTDIVRSPPLAVGEALPPLPPGVTRGRRFGEYQIAAVRSTPAAHEVLLAGEGRRFVLRLRPWTATDHAAMRRGRWAIEVVGAPSPDALPGRLRAAVGAFARSLPSEALTQGGPPTAAAPVVPAVRGSVGEVVCTAPWTTLEVVDPDGGVRQCCADWTVGERGNIHHDPLLSVWNGPGYQHARRVMAGPSLSALCHDICPRLYDRKFGGERFEVHSGAEAYVRNQLLLAEDIAARREEVRGRPLYIALCPSTYCNYDCIMCTHGRTPRRELPERIWDELPTLLPTLRVLTLLGGEPLANPLAMRFLRQYDRDRYPDASVSLVTNGSLLGEQALKHLGRCRFGHVTVSLNAGTAAVYEAVQRGVTLDEVLRNVDALRRFCAAQPRRFDIALSFVVQPANAHTLVAFGELASARDLAVRLLPLSPNGPDGLDYYADPDAVARVLQHLDEFVRWAEAARPGYLPEIAASREAIRREAASRAHAARRLPMIVG